MRELQADSGDREVGAAWTDAGLSAHTMGFRRVPAPSDSLPTRSRWADRGLDGLDADRADATDLGRETYNAEVLAGDLAVVPLSEGRSPSQRRKDARIRDEVLDCLRGMPTVDASDVVLDVRDGIVHLRGTVGTRGEKWLVEDCSALVPGVFAVRSSLQISIAS